MPYCKPLSFVAGASVRVSEDPRRRSWLRFPDVPAVLGAVVSIQLLGPLPAASRIKSIEFAKVKASFGGICGFIIIIFNAEASRRSFRGKGQTDPNTWVWGGHGEEVKESHRGLGTFWKVGLTWAASPTAERAGREKTEGWKAQKELPWRRRGKCGRGFVCSFGEHRLGSC